MQIIKKLSSILLVIPIVGFSSTQNFSYTYNMDNELTSINNAQETFNYDANGNLVSDNQGHVYSYNLENELMHFANASGTTANYTYYPNTMRATKQVNNGIPVTFYYNGDKYAQIVNEAQGNNDYTSYAMLGNNRYIRLVHQLGSSTPITKQYLVKDNKNVIAELDKDQNINIAHVYNPYGTQTDVDGLSSQSTSTQASSNGSFNILNNPFTYESEYNDSESGLVYLRARYYSPDLMRFISRDTADLPNRYNYADGNPISNIDPSGHMAGWLAGIKMLAIATANAIVGAAATASGAGYYAGNGMELAAGYQFSSALGYFGQKHVSSKTLGKDVGLSYAAGFTGLGVEMAAGGAVGASAARIGLSSKAQDLAKFAIAEPAAAPFMSEDLYDGHAKQAFSSEQEENYMAGVIFAEGIAKPRTQEYFNLGSEDGQLKFKHTYQNNEATDVRSGMLRSADKNFFPSSSPENIKYTSVRVAHSRTVYTARTVGQYLGGLANNGSWGQELDSTDAGPAAAPAIDGGAYGATIASFYLFT